MVSTAAPACRIAKVDGAVVTRIETKVERTATDAVKVLVLNVLPKYVAEDVCSASSTTRSARVGG